MKAIARHSLRLFPPEYFPHLPVRFFRDALFTIPMYGEALS
jgi:hypothetical protein